MKADFIRVGTVEDIPKGEGRCFSVEDRRIAVFHLESGDFRAVDQQCPHRGGPLSDGLLGGDEVICPMHGWKINLSTGALVGTKPVSVPVYPVRIEKGDIVIEIRDSFRSDPPTGIK